MAYGPFNAGAGKGGGGSAADTSYDNSTSGIEASNVQDALDTVLGATLPRLTVKVAAGSAITITDGTSTITGTANTAGSFTTNLPRTGTWSVSATLNGESTDGSVNAASLGGNYTIELAYFAATLTVSAKAGTVVTASCNGTTYSGTAASTGKATITIKKAGTYTVTGVYSGVASNSASVSVTTNGGSYTASLSFITLTVTVDTGSTITVKNGSTTLTDTSTGSNTFYLPNTGTWEVTASLNGQTATGSVNATAYQGYTLALSYVSKTLNSNSWATIKKVSDANQGANYWAVGDTKTITAILPAATRARPSPSTARSAPRPSRTCLLMPLSRASTTTARRKEPAASISSLAKRAAKWSALLIAATATRLPPAAHSP